MKEQKPEAGREATQKAEERRRKVESGSTEQLGNRKKKQKGEAKNRQEKTESNKTA